MYFTWFLTHELVGGELTMGQNYWLPLAPIPFFHQENHAFSAICYICRLKPVKPVFWSTNQPWDICTRFKHYLHSTEWSCIINYHTHSLQTRSTKMPHTKQRIEWHPFVGKGEPLLLKIWQEKHPWVLLQPVFNTLSFMTYAYRLWYSSTNQWMNNINSYTLLLQLGRQNIQY